MKQMKNLNTAPTFHRHNLNSAVTNRRPRQLSLIKKEKIEIQCGGEKLRARKDGRPSSAIGKRKIRRPLATNRPTHIILKSGRARGKFAFSPSRYDLKQLVQKMGPRFGVRVYGVALNWSHVHMVVRLPSRIEYMRFIRALTGAMVLKLYGSEVRGKFFDQTPFTKPGTWGAQLKNWIAYLEKNEWQSQGWSPRSN